MQIKHTLYFDGEDRTFEGMIVDDDGRKFQSYDLDEFMAAVELFHENNYSLGGIDMMQLENDDAGYCDGCCGDCDSCDCEDPECSECCEECDAEEDCDCDCCDDCCDPCDDCSPQVGVVRSIHIHSIELIGIAAAAAFGWKLLKKLLKR